MIKLKGGDDKNSIMASAAKRMGLPMANAKGAKSGGPSNYTSPGSHHAQQMSSSSSSSSAIPDGPTPLAQRLGMPSAVAAMTADKNKKDWSNKSNRIALGAPVYIKGKSYRDDSEEHNDITDDKPKHKLGDATTHSDDEDSDDEFLTGGDEEGRLLAAMREKRLAELKATTGKQQQWLGMGHGVYTDVVQDEFLKAVTASKYVVCHFYHSNFETCRTIDNHLTTLSRTHLPTRFIKINAEKAPFFTQKLQVKMLPTVVLFKDGIAIDRVVGFDELGGVQEFETAVLEKRLAKGGVILVKGGGEGGEEVKRQDGVRGSIRSGGRGAGSESEGDED